jgi:anti-anti-sigma regulatory factor
MVRHETVMFPSAPDLHAQHDVSGMKSDGHFSVSTDATSNLLSVRLLGNIDPDSMQACVDQIASQLPALATGFAMLTDLSELNSMDTRCVPEVERMMDLCRKKGVSMVVRVIPDPAKDIGFSILSLFHYPHNVHIVTCPTLAEAQHVLG